MKFFANALLFRLLAKRLGVKESGGTRLTSLPLSDYAREVFSALKIYTVRDALFAWALHQETPGVGEKTWQDLFDAIR